jgi:hypothetical protein
MAAPADEISTQHRSNHDDENSPIVAMRQIFLRGTTAS